MGKIALVIIESFAVELKSKLLRKWLSELPALKDLPPNS
jgi:hypothetical protein